MGRVGVRLTVTARIRGRRASMIMTSSRFAPQVPVTVIVQMGVRVLNMVAVSLKKESSSKRISMSDSKKQTLNTTDFSRKGAAAA